jgi:hypothetical protein
VLINIALPIWHYQQDKGQKLFLYMLSIFLIRFGGRNQWCQAIPTGKRAIKFSKHISETCARCGSLEDEMHMLFLYPFTKAAWFSSLWHMRTEMIAQPYYPLND